MTYYNLAINNTAKEFYSIKSIKKEFKKDKHLFEFLETESFLYIDKFNDRSRRSGKVYPLTNYKIHIIWESFEKQYNGAYGN
jgi:hypothetical protein